MEKSFKLINKIIIIACVDIFMCAVGFVMSEFGVFIDISKLILKMSYFILIIVLLILLIWAFVLIFCGVKNGIRNIIKYDGEPFESIDFYLRHWEENNAFYINEIKIIKHFYESEEINNLVENNDLEKFYKRRDYLSKQEHLFEYVFAYMETVAVSFLTAMFLDKYEKATTIMEAPLIILLFILLLSIMVIRYIKRGQNGTYIYFIYRYEKQLIDKKIDIIINKIKMLDGEEKQLYNKQVILKELYRINIKNMRKYNRNELRRDIETINNMNLYIDNFEKYYFKTYAIGDREISLPYYRIKSGKEKERLANSNYKKLYNILKKYNLIDNND